MQLKQKLSLGLIFLFAVILCFGILGIISIRRMSNDAEKILQNNNATLIYCNNMLEALENIPQDSDAVKIFKDNLSKQEANITEPGELESTREVHNKFEDLVVHKDHRDDYSAIRHQLHYITYLNQQAIIRKNAVAHHTAQQATLWLTIIFTILTLIAFTFILNFPAVISAPVSELSAGIKEIANRNYRKRIYLKKNDEFGELIQAFNQMAERLDEYEHSNLAKIKFEKSRIEAIINQMKDAIIGFDEKQQILFMNKVAESLSGLEEREVTGLYGPDVALKNDLMRSLLQKDAPAEFKIYANKKESYFIKETVVIKNEEKQIGSVIVLRNITPFHELDEAKTNFIATVSHELKTPISSIKMGADLLKDTRIGSLNNEQQELVNGMEDDADRLLKITGELLNMAQVETGNIQLTKQGTSPALLVEKALQTVQFPAQQKKISFNLAIEDNLPDINIDPEKTAWVLINFLTNAIKYSPEESSVQVAVTKKGREIIFSVHDNGKGIEEKYLSRIFDRYFKVPGNIQQSGTGLGLAISKEFIEAQGGHIAAESQVGEGSTFSFNIPF